MNKQKKEFNLILLFVCILFGIIFSMQIKSVIAERELQKGKSKIDEFKETYNSIKNQNIAIQDDIDNIQKKIDDYLKDEIENQSENKWDSPFDVMNSKIKKNQLLAGLTDVKGPGIIMKINDADVNELRAMGVNIDDIQELSPYTIHDSDIKRILNEIKEAGAQAISINDERIITPTRILCSGPTILINSHLYAAPYEIKVIGDKDVLSDTLANNPYIQLLLQNKLRIEITKYDNLFINKYNTLNLENYISLIKEDVPQWEKN